MEMAPAPPAGHRRRSRLAAPLRRSHGPTRTFVQTGKLKPVPVLLFGREYWERIIRFDALVEGGTIGPEDLELFQYVETAEEAWAAIRDFYGLDVGQGTESRD